MFDQFDNPITMSFNLLEKYKSLFRQTLANNQLSSDDIEAILANTEIDQGVLFSSNRKYKQGQQSFRQFCLDSNLAEVLSDWIDLTRLYIHQEKAIQSILKGDPTIISTGTGSGKTESFLIPILDHCLKNPGEGIKAIIIYPMNALANDQLERLAEYTKETDISFGIYVGSTPEHASDTADAPPRLNQNHLIYRDEIRQQPPNILITNYVMLDWMLTNAKTRSIFTASHKTVKYLVLDEIHSYRGNKATHIRFLLKRLRYLLSDTVLPIGASATLRETDPQSGYLGGNSLDEFIKSLLDIEDYCLIEPTYEPEPETTPRPTPLFDASQQYGWTFSVNDTTALQNLSLLTGEQYSDFDLVATDFTTTRPYQALQEDAFIKAVRQALLEGAQSFLDLVKLFRRIYSDSPSDKAEEIVQAYLSAISYLNHQATQDSPPLLDFRIHLFLKDIGGYLKRCLKCNQYHSGIQEFCQNCGFPLFMVYRRDVRRCIGKVTDGQLKYELKPESDDKKNAFYVLISLVEPDSTSSTNQALRFLASSVELDGQIPLTYSTHGHLQLDLLPATRYDEVKPDLINLIDGCKDYQYLHHLVKSILDFQSGLQKKLLGFIDNREKASRFSSVLRDEFVDQFFEEFLKLHYSGAGQELNLVRAWLHLKNSVPSVEQQSELEKAVFKEMPLWYARFISMPPRFFDSKADVLALKEIEMFDPFERELLNIFLIERAIDKQAEDWLALKPDIATESYFIRFQCHWATDHRGIYGADKQGSELRDHPSISLSKDAQEYAAFISRYDPERQIIPTLRKLVNVGVLVERETPDQKVHYYLNPTWLYLQLGAPRYDDYDELREQFLLTAGLHSSELKSQQRQTVESNFKQSRLNFLLATPTLEMGIDIGQLRNVLMVGVPPLPSSYAQRTGRAGRGSGNNYALIVTFCSEISNHDMYYFKQPRKMINGLISPPAFNPTNLEVVKKHLHAFVLADELKNSQTLNGFLKSLDPEPEPELIEQIRPVFEDSIDINPYLASSEFKTQIHTLIEKGQFNQCNLRQLCYSSGIFPDYMFRRDMVSVIDQEQFEDIQHLAQKSANVNLADFSLSEREPEQAYYKFSPGETVFMAGGVYKILATGGGMRYLENGTRPVRSYDYFMADSLIGYATKSKTRKKYKRSQLIVGRSKSHPLHQQYKVLKLIYYPECTIALRNDGLQKFGEIEVFQDGQETFSLGYDLLRQAIVLEFDRNVCADPRLYLSLVSALDRTIKDKYGLDKSEIRLLVDVQPKGQEPDPTKIWIALYDFDGNGNIPLQKIFDQFGDIVVKAHQTMIDCKCEHGCYLCMRSYNTHIYANKIDKETALMFTGYLLGQTPFEPAIAQPERSSDQTDLTLQLQQSGSQFTLTVQPGGRVYRGEMTNDSQNRTIFQLFIKAICAEFIPSMKTLKVLSRQDYIVNAINRGEVDKDRDAFAELQFHLLRFAHVTAEKG